MKKIIIYMLLFSIVFILYMCNFTKYKYYNPISKNYNSGSVKESKEIKVFIAEYIPENYEYIFLGDTLNIDEVWLEKCWVSTYFWNELDTTYNQTDCFNIYIRVKKYTSEAFYKSLRVGKFSIQNTYGDGIGAGRRGDDLISLPYREFVMLSPDTLIYPVYTYSHKNGDMNAEKLGEIKLFKKK